MPIILVSWEAEIEEFTVPGESREKVCETPSQWQKAGHGGAHLSFQLGWEA
jgi:predicted PolB exonuclease-like 3'-5' exonuclease